MSQFEYKENDNVGSETLEVVGKADKFNKWMFDTIRPFCKGEILEIGSGVGNISYFFLQDGASITLSDIRTSYCEKLKSKFSDKHGLVRVKCIDLADREFELKYNNLFNRFDTVFALNVVEHIFDDNLAVENARKLLKKNGHLIILVPAYQSLFNGFDKHLEHYRRYTKSSLSPLLNNAGLKIIHRQYFNIVGILGWFVSGKIQKNKIIPSGQMGLYNLLVPIFKVIDLLTLNKWGLSVVVVGKK
jgi:2-polyprenyl-3-methyl-5-hydroxy-6-metoxy-1,4-benzoquinol methylase